MVFALEREVPLTWILFIGLCGYDSMAPLAVGEHPLARRSVPKVLWRASL